MLEQPKAGLISQFYRQVENRLKNPIKITGGAPNEKQTLNHFVIVLFLKHKSLYSEEW